MSKNGFDGKKKFTPIKLKRVKPVPSDIDIAKASELKQVTLIA